VNRKRQHERGVEALLARTRLRFRVDRIVPRLRRPRVEEVSEQAFDAGGDLDDILRAKEVDPDEDDGEVEDGDELVYAEGVPPIRLDQVLEALGHGGIGRESFEMGLGRGLGARVRHETGRKSSEEARIATRGAGERRESETGGGSEGEQGTCDAWGDEFGYVEARKDYAHGGW
jgi:hypothetical protein